MRISLDPEYYFRKLDRQMSEQPKVIQTKKIFSYKDFETPAKPSNPEPPVKKKPGRKPKAVSSGKIRISDYPVTVSFG
jgi:hypothetical protein